MTPYPNVRTPLPPYRRLKAFAFDPIFSRQIDTYDVNEMKINIPWDENLELGPIDSYLEIVDYDPSSQAFYAPVDLNNPKLLAQDGLSPSEGNPQFHQQMVYAVARTTIDHFDHALGRRSLWSIRPTKNKDTGELKDEFVEHLRIYPHALRDANAYYSPVKKAMLFGYFPASSTEFGQNMPGETVFTCLSHDIIAHETTHALVDGLHPRFLEPSNMDVWALHEALADIVALFQHFTYPKVLKHQIARTQGDLERQNLLGELAFQFGQAIGQYGALRSAIGEIDPKTNKWVPKQPDPTEILRTFEPHGRGAILVAAIFDAFLAIYKSRIRDLLRIASGGTGILQPGEIHPDLVERLAQEAAKTAQHILHMCIRALDYCPPVDIEFGDYLRALVTADVELVTDDRHNYRLAVIDAFRKRGIYPRDIRNLSIESLIWHVPTEDDQKEFRKIFHGPANLRKLVLDWNMQSDRKKIFIQALESRKKMQEWLENPNALGVAKAAHITLDTQGCDTSTSGNIPGVAKAADVTLDKGKDSLYRAENGLPEFEVNSVRPARRIGPNGQTIAELVIEVTQRRRGYFDVETQTKVDRGEIDPPDPDFIMWGGCTLLVDPETAFVRYCIYKDILSQNRLDRMRKFLMGGAGPSLRATYFGDPYRRHISGWREETHSIEPFAFLHRRTDLEEEFDAKKEE